MCGKFFLLLLNLFTKNGLGKQKYQHFFNNLFETSIRGMNIGMGDDFSKSGEMYVVNYLYETYFHHQDFIIIFDVGANNGEYSKKLADHFDSKAKIFSFEPSQKTFSILKTALVHFTNVKFFNFGFSDVCCITDLFQSNDPTESGLSSVYNRNLQHMNRKMDFVEKIELKKLDNFCEENNIDHINFLKLDTEGNEYKILLGAQKMIDNDKIDYIQFEFGRL